MIEDLITYIKNLLNIPYIEENNAVMDGSFNVEPYMSDGLLGDGEVCAVNNYYAVNLFYNNKSDAMTQGISLWKNICQQNNYTSDIPYYTYEDDADMWMATLNIQEVMR